jgi:hypothetical protein
VHSQWHGGDFFGYRRPWCEINDDQSEEDRTIGKYALSVNALAHRLQHVMLACGQFLWPPPELVELLCRRDRSSSPSPKRRKMLKRVVTDKRVVSAFLTTAFASKRHHHQSLKCPIQSWQSLKCLLNSGFLNIVGSIATHRCLTVAYSRLWPLWCILAIDCEHIVLHRAFFWLWAAISK